MTTARVCARLLSCVLPVSLAACSAGHGGASSERARRTHQADSNGNPLWYVTSGGTPGPVEGYKASEVDGAGNTYVLSSIGSAGSEVGQPERIVSAYDPNGAMLWRAYLDENTTYALHEQASSMRVRDTTVATAGTGTNPDLPRNGRRLFVRVFDTSGRSQWEWWGANGSNGGDAVDVCGDGSVVVTSGSSALLSLDGGGTVQWSAPLPFTNANTFAKKLRCGGGGEIRYFTSTSSGAALVDYGGDGTASWSWTSDPSAQGGSFDVDDSGNTYVATTLVTTGPAGTAHRMAVDALDSSGAALWSWRSDGPSDSLGAVTADGGGNVTVAGARANDVYVVRLDPGGNVVWTRDDPSTSGAPAAATGVMMDGAGNAFVSGVADGGIAALYGAADGSPLWTFNQPSFAPIRADVTNGVGRCVGRTSNSGFGVLALEVY